MLRIDTSPSRCREPRKQTGFCRKPSGMESASLLMDDTRCLPIPPSLSREWGGCSRHSEDVAAPPISLRSWATRPQERRCP